MPERTPQGSARLLPTDALLARNARSEQIQTVAEINGHDQRVDFGIGHHVDTAKSFGVMPGDGGVEPRLLHVGV